MPPEYKKEPEKPKKEPESLDISKYLTPDAYFGETNMDRNLIKNAHINDNKSSERQLYGKVSGYKQWSFHNIEGEAHYKNENGSIFSLGAEYDHTSWKNITVGFEKWGEWVTWSGDVSVWNNPEANIGFKIPF